MPNKISDEEIRAVNWGEIDPHPTPGKMRPLTRRLKKVVCVWVAVMSALTLLALADIVVRYQPRSVLYPIFIAFFAWLFPGGLVPYLFGVHWFRVAKQEGYSCWRHYQVKKAVRPLKYPDLPSKTVFRRSTGALVCTFFGFVLVVPSLIVMIDSPTTFPMAPVTFGLGRSLASLGIPVLLAYIHDNDVWVYRMELIREGLAFPAEALLARDAFGVLWDMWRAKKHPLKKLFGL